MKTTNSFSVILLASVLLLLIPLSYAYAGDVTLAWDPNLEPDLAGYKLYYGNASGIYSTILNVGNVTTHTRTGLPPGTYFFAVTAYNTAQAESTYSNEVSQTISQPPTDTTPPVISGVTATGITGTSAIISWTTNEAADSMVDFGTSASYGSSTSLNSSLATSHSQTINDLTPAVLYHYRVRSRDAEGNLSVSSDATFTTAIAGDSIAPAVAFTLPVSAASYSTGSLSLNIAGSASDNVGVTLVTWTNSRSGSGTATGTTSWSASGITLLSGSNIITVTARDAAGNSAAATLTVTCTPEDATSPTVAFTSPVPAASYSTGSLSLNIAGSASDNVGVTLVTWTNSRGGSGTATGTTSWSASGITLLSGSNIITVTARDAAGNSAAATLTVTCTPEDATSPTVAFTSPVPAASYSTGSLSLNIAGSASDNVGVTLVTWTNSRGGSGTATGTTSWSASGITLLSGSNIITVTARDAAGNSAAATLTVTCTPVDATSPTVAFTAPVSAAAYSTGTSSLNIAGSASDNVGVTLVTWTNSRGGSGTATGTTSWSASGITLLSGSNIITVTARDAAGNSGIATLNVTRTTADTTAPIVAITAPVTATTYRTSAPSLNVAGTASDNVGIAQLTWTNSRGGSGTATGTTSWSASGITLLSGSNIITVTARDAAGNSGSDKLTVTFTPPDTAPPVISGMSVVTATTTATIRWTTNEAANTQAEYGRSTSFGNSTALNGILVTSHSQVLTGLTADTQYYFRVKSRNAAGSLAVSQNYTFKTRPSSNSHRLFYPSLSLAPEKGSESSAEEFTAAALSNFNSSIATLTFTAFDKNGIELQGENITNPVIKEINPGEQFPAIDFQLFGDGLFNSGTLGQIRVDSTTDKLVGLFLAFDSAHSTMDGAEISSTPLTSIILPELGDQESTKIILNNPNSEPATATIDLLYSDGRIRASAERTIVSNGTLHENIYREMFTEAVYDPSDYLRVYSDKKLLAYISLKRQTRDFALVPGSDPDSEADLLYSPQYVVGGSYRTTLSIVNLDPVAGIVTLKLIGNDASQLGDTRVLSIAPGGKLYISDQSFFGNTLGNSAESFIDGYVEVSSNGVHLTGSVAFEDAKNGTFLAALPLVSTFYRSIVFSHVASNETYFTGLAMMNPHDADAVATIDLYNPDQTLAATVTQTIPAKQRVCRLLTELFPLIKGQDRHSGYFRVTVDKEIAAFALFATWDLQVLSAIPAQAVP